MIVESFQLAATNTDVLVAPSRLAAIPYSGMLVVEMQASINEVANHWEVTIQLPNGDVPMDGFIVPEGVNAGSLNADDKYTIAFPVAQGGHVLIAATETGVSVLDIRCTLTP